MAGDRAPIRRVLAIAGSDSGGGAGIQADLKALARSGVHGMTAVTAITAQSTVGVSSIHAIPPAIVVDQVRAVAEDIGVDAVKIGMLGASETIAAVAQALDLLSGAPVVIDPVMVAESGAVLLDEDAREALLQALLPRAAVVTPNLAEARILAGDEHGRLSPEDLARAVRERGAQAVVVTGGHVAGATDVFFDGTDLVPIAGERYPDGAAHGSGCTHSSTLAAQLARGATPLAAARTARAVAAEAVRDGLGEIGSGAGPVDVLGVRDRDAPL